MRRTLFRFVTGAAAAGAMLPAAALAQGLPTPPVITLPTVQRADQASVEVPVTGTISPHPHPLGATVERGLDFVEVYIPFNPATVCTYAKRATAPMVISANTEPATGATTMRSLGCELGGPENGPAEVAVSCQRDTSVQISWAVDEVGYTGVSFSLEGEDGANGYVEPGDRNRRPDRLFCGPGGEVDVRIGGILQVAGTARPPAGPIDLATINLDFSY